LWELGLFPKFSFIFLLIIKINSKVSINIRNCHFM
jgi:hypothetical protein